MPTMCREFRASPAESNRVEPVGRPAQARQWEAYPCRLDPTYDAMPRRASPHAMSGSPKELLARMAEIVRRAFGVAGRREDVRKVLPPPNSVCYCDPPYKSTTGYNGKAWDVVSWANSLPVTCYVSEAVPLSTGARAVPSRTRGRLNGSAINNPTTEFLSIFNGEWRTPPLPVQLPLFA
jgi:hypothetical protein